MESVKPVKVLMMNCDKLVNLDEIKAHLFPSTHDQYFAVKIEYFDIDDIDSRSKEMSERSKDEKYDVGIFAVHANESRLSINEKKAGIGYAKIYNAIREMTGDKVVVIIAYDSNYKDPTHTISRWARFKISSQFSGEYLDGPKGFVLSWQKHPERRHKDVMHQFITSVRQDIQDSIRDMYKESKPAERKAEEGSSKKKGRENENAKKDSKSNSEKTSDSEDDSDKDIDIESEQDSSKTRESKPAKRKAVEGSAKKNGRENVKETSKIDRTGDGYNAGMTEDHAFETALRESKEIAVKTALRESEDKSKVTHGREKEPDAGPQKKERRNEKGKLTNKEGQPVKDSATDVRPKERRQAVKAVKEGSGHSSYRCKTVGASAAPKHAKQWKTETCQRGKGPQNVIEEIKEMMTLTVLIVYDRNIQNIDELGYFDMEYSGLEIIPKEFDQLDERFQLATEQLDGAVLVVDANNIPKHETLQWIYSELSQRTENKVVLAFANDKSNMAEDTLYVSDEVKQKVRSNLQFDDSCIDGTVSYVLSWKTYPKSPHKKAIRNLLDRKVIEKRDNIYDAKTGKMDGLWKMFQNPGDTLKRWFETPTQVKKTVEDFLKWTKHQDGKLVALITWTSGKSDRSLENMLLYSKIIEFKPREDLPSWIEDTQEFNRCRENASVVCGVFQKKGNYILLTYNLKKR